MYFPPAFSFTNIVRKTVSLQNIVDELSIDLRELEKGKLQLRSKLNLVESDRNDLSEKLLAIDKRCKGLVSKCLELDKNLKARIATNKMLGASKEKLTLEFKTVKENMRMETVACERLATENKYVLSLCLSVLKYSIRPSACVLRLPSSI